MLLLSLEGLWTNKSVGKTQIVSNTGEKNLNLRKVNNFKYLFDGGFFWLFFLPVSMINTLHLYSLNCSILMENEKQFHAVSFIFTLEVHFHWILCLIVGVKCKFWPREHHHPWAVKLGVVFQRYSISRLHHFKNNATSSILISENWFIKAYMAIEGLLKKGETTQSFNFNTSPTYISNLCNITCLWYFTLTHSCKFTLYS